MSVRSLTVSFLVMCTRFLYDSNRSNAVIATAHTKNGIRSGLYGFGHYVNCC
jgi:hypothetical protein